MRFNKRVWMFVIGAVAALTIGGGAGATVTVNNDGSGFVGKGDVQAAFGWNNAQFQRNAAAVTFSLANELDEVQRCWQWQNGETVGFWFRYRTFDEDQLYTYPEEAPDHWVCPHRDRRQLVLSPRRPLAVRAPGFGLPR